MTVAQFPRGVRLNNPMNLMESGSISYVGEIKPSSDPLGRLCQFDTMTNGVRAGARCLMAYYARHNLTTIRQIVSRFAPPNENNTDAYVEDVSKRTSFDPDTTLNVIDPPTLVALCKAIIHHEQGYDVCADAIVTTAVNSALL